MCQLLLCLGLQGTRKGRKMISCNQQFSTAHSVKESKAKLISVTNIFANYQCQHHTASALLYLLSEITEYVSGVCTSGAQFLNWNAS